MEALSEFSNELQALLLTENHKRKVEKGTFLFQEGMKANELFIIESGLIQISKIVPDGRELTLRMCSNGDLIGELALFCSSPKYMLNAKVMESGEVTVISQYELEERLKKEHQLAIELMKWTSLQYRKAQTKFRDLILHGKKGALYSTLIRLSNSYGEFSELGITINIPLTNQELANFCGTSREVVNRMLGELRRKEIVSVEKGIITIHNLAYLKNEIDCENCPVEVCNIE
ncbi:Crp/Fnr family transcriptional regulator [Bacillus sp. S/N-304-OC-R1]|uniref:Crp/Fnr family transcriptional regulator n=1 Tax=Bacillus sp. S/N-304-OC-R1 TaxID=2758034 RepID=UPI001C8E822B|nr:Crp/Fnr family transcriptional regulator [Bacillus sp. S/N-304-OC-R1]MBY0121047.1 Crp/Fnr family transcriptional regulator [Bacillus sp. S/N-304-OC-R1]